MSDEGVEAELWDHLHSDAHPEVLEVSDSSPSYVSMLHDDVHNGSLAETHTHCTRCDAPYSDPNEELIVCPTCTADLVAKVRSIIDGEEHADGCPVTTATVGPDGFLSCDCDPLTWD